VTAAGERVDGPHYSEVELMTILMSREVRDGEVSACGALSQIPAAGLLLAKELHAPAAELIILNTAFKPFHTSRQFHFLAQRGELGLFFVSGVQIDGHGNYNLHQLGKDPERPEARFPGGYGGGMIYYCARRTVVFRTEHTRRSLVDRVDFISAAGSSPANVLRLVLDSIHPSCTFDEIRENTGFDLGATGPVASTPAPTAGELRVLRSVVRPKMIETGTYADWAQRFLGNG